MDDTERPPDDLTALCERLAERLAAHGAAHPMSAAVALAVRGLEGVGPDAFARQLRVGVDDLARIEAGDVQFEALPAPIRRRAEVDPRLDLDRLR